jgi:hypothetical protein
LRVSDAQAITTKVGATLSLVTAGAIVFVLFVASYSRRSTWLALCSMSVSMAVVFGCLFLSTVHDHNHVRMWLAWTASKLPLTVYRQIADDLAAALEHLATSPRCDIGRQGCNEAMSAAFLPTKGVAKQPAAAVGWTETKPDPKAMSRYPVAWRQAVDDRDYLIRTIAFEASGEPAMAKIAVAYVVLNRKKRAADGVTISRLW